MTSSAPNADPIDADPVAVAREICLRLLERQPRTRAELVVALRRRRVPEEAATAALDRLEEARLIDDRAFARAWVSSRHAGRGLARRALSVELRRRGVAQSLVNEALTAVDSEEEEAAARALVIRRLPQLSRVDPPTWVRRIVAMLVRRGYEPATAYRLVREVAGGHHGAATGGCIAGGAEIDDQQDTPEPDREEHAGKRRRVGR